jgi:hypothetical protein
MLRCSAAPKIRTYVVPRDNIWSGSAFRNIDPTAFFGVYIGLTAVFFVCEEGGRTYVWKVGAETGKPRATPGGSDSDENPAENPAALKGRNTALLHTLVVPFQGVVFSSSNPAPRAMPWAGMSLPLRGGMQIAQHKNSRFRLVRTGRTLGAPIRRWSSGFTSYRSGRSRRRAGRR